MKQTACKIAFFMELITFILLSLGLIIAAFVKTSQMSIIGGADWYSFRLQLQLLLTWPIRLALSSAFWLSIVTFILWRRNAKK